MDKTVRVQESLIVFHQEAKSALHLMFLSALQKITKHVFKIKDTFAIILMTTQVAT